MIKQEMIIAGLMLTFACLTLSADVEIENILNQMDGTDKCGQMTQVTFDVIANDGNDVNNPLNLTRLQIAVVNYKVGSILNTPYNIAAKGQVWRQVIKAMHDAAKDSKLKIPVLYGIDSIHGANYIQEATLFPQPISQGATFNVELAEKIGEVVAKETRAVGIPWNFSPVMDIGRQPIWPRLWETFGEDVRLAQTLGEAYIRGHQGKDNNLLNHTKTATCLKHYIGYSFPFNGRDRSVAWIPESLLREYFLPPFETALAAGSQTVMINSGDVNGLPGHANYRYLTEILKQELGFQGFTVSDWEDIKRLHTRDKLAETPEEAVRMAVMAGVDMSMVPYDFSFYDHCVALHAKDSKFAARTTDAVRRILTVKKQLGLLKHTDSIYPTDQDFANLDTDDAHALSLEAARESIVLAKNDGTLPLNKDQKILVSGATANLLKVLNGGWSYTWQGDKEEYFQTFSKRNHKTILEALQAHEHINTLYREGANFTHVTNIDEAIEEAKNVDIIVLCIGEDTYTETPGNIDNMMLSDSQMQLANALLETGKHVVVVYVGGRPRTITSIVKKANAVLLAFLPGNRGGEAITDIIYGDYNPNGKMPITYSKGPNGAMTYDYKPIEDFEKHIGENVASYFDAIFPFGHGLSYTTFEYSNLKLDQSTVMEPNSVTGSVDVKNNGPKAGKETVIVYLNDEYGSLSRPVKQMKYFEKVSLNPGQSKTVKFEITRYDMSFIDLDNNRIVESGKFNVFVDKLNSSFTLTAKAPTPMPTTTVVRPTVTTSASVIHSISSMVLIIFTAFSLIYAF